jgi:DnaJ-class molecular chaperone
MGRINECYELLGIKSDASDEEIKRAYRDLVLVWHPDRFAHNPTLQEKAQDKLKEINAAHDFILKHFSSNNDIHSNSNSSSSATKTQKSQGGKSPCEPKRFQFPPINKLQVREIFTTWSESHSTALKYFGSFIENITVNQTVTKLAEIQYVFIERSIEDGEHSGEKYRRTEDKTELYEYDFDAPTGEIKNEESASTVLLNSVRTHACEPTKGCAYCSGSGKCTNCNRAGHIICDRCDGKGQTKTKRQYLKNGKTRLINESCSKCSGNGWLHCPDCGGGRICNTCDGRGYMVCDKCDGSSKFQTFAVCTSTFRENVTNKVYTEYKEIIEHVKGRSGELVYDDILLEWKNEKIIEINNLAPIRNYDEENHTTIASSIESEINRKNPKLRIARVSLKITAIPVAEVKYTFEGKPYIAFIVGKENYIFAEGIPDCHFMPLPFWSVGLRNKFNSKNTSLAFTYLAAYLFFSDGKFSREESDFIEMLVDCCAFKEKKKGILLNKLTSEKIESAEVIKRITPFIEDINAKLFGWYLTTFDGQIKEDRIKAYNDIFRGSNSCELDAQIKDKVTCLKRLPRKILIDEFVRLHPQFSYKSASTGCIIVLICAVISAGYYGYRFSNQKRQIQEITSVDTIKLNSLSPQINDNKDISMNQVLAKVYGDHDDKHNCWITTNNENRYCMKLDRSDKISGNAGERQYVLLGGEVVNEQGEPNGAHADMGLVGAFIIELRNGGGEIVASNPKIQIGTSGSAPKNWQFIKLGPSNIWGWKTTWNDCHQGYCGTMFEVIGQDGNEIKNIAHLVSSYDDCGTGLHDNDCTTLESQFEIGSSENTNNLYPLFFTVSGKKNGTKIQTVRWKVPFDTSKGTYTEPKEWPFAERKF